LQRTSVAFLLVLQAGKSSLTLLLPRGLASKPGVEALAAKPQEDDPGCHRLLCVSSALTTSDLLVEDALATHCLLAFKGSLQVKKALSSMSSLLAGGLLAFVGSTLVKWALSGTSNLLTGGLLRFVGRTLIKRALASCRLEAVALVLP
jgi:hypothetical protein